MTSVAIAPQTLVDRFVPPARYAARRGTPLARVLQGYRRACAGAVGEGRKLVLTGLERSARVASPLERGVALLAAAEVASRAADWRGASALYVDAARSLAEGPYRAASAALALAVEAALTCGTVDDAEVSLRGVELPPSALPDTTGLADAVLSLARGHTADARLRLKALSDDGRDAWTRSFASLLSAEVLLELGALPGAGQALTNVVVPASDLGSELHLRLLRLSAELSLALAIERPTDEPLDDTDRGLRAVLTRLESYAAGDTVHQAWTAQLRGERALLLEQSPTSWFERAARIAGDAGARGLHARLVARQVTVARRAEARRLGERAALARQLLLDVGADARARALAQRGSQGKASAQQLRKSITVRLQGDVLSNDATGIEAVIEVSRYLASIRQLDELLEKILDSVVRVMRADRGVLLRVGDGGALDCAAARGLSRDQVVEGSNEISFGVVREAERTGEPVLSDNALSDERFRERRSVMATDIRSVLCSPIRTQNRTLGYVYLDRRMSQVPFDEEHQDLLAAFCTQVAVAWENTLAFEEIERLNVGLEQKVKERTVELRERNEDLRNTLDELTNTRLRLAEAQRDALEKEMHLARDIQRSILPAEGLVERPGARLAGKCVPASFCGGDWWAFTDNGEDETLFVIVDVTGHGVAAALITAVARACLDTLGAMSEGASPVEVLRHMNTAVCNAARGELMATAFCVLVRPSVHELRFANAGHNFPYLCAEKTDPQPLVAQGTRLGESEDLRLSECVAPYQSGDRLVLFTDGIVEWMNPAGKEFGGRRLRKSLQAHAGAAPEALLDDLIGDAQAFADGTPCDDDLTLVVVDLED